MSKNPFVGFTEAQVKDLESRYFVVETNKDFLTDENGAFLFSHKTAILYRNKALTALNKLVKGDNKADAKEANEIISSMRIIPIRVQ